MEKSIGGMCDKQTAAYLMERLDGVPLGEPFAVLSALDRISHRKSASLKSAISGEFSARVHSLAVSVL